MAVKIQNRADTRLNWEAFNPILALGEIGLDKDSKLIKIGDGVTPWNDLPYYTPGSGLGDVDGGTATDTTSDVIDGGYA